MHPAHLARGSVKHCCLKLRKQEQTFKYLFHIAKVIEELKIIYYKTIGSGD